MKSLFRRVFLALKPVRTFAAKLPTKLLAIVALGSLGVVLVVFLAVFFWPRTVAFSYAGQNCFFNPVVFPGLVKEEPGPTFDAYFANHVWLGNFSLYSPTTCLQLSSPPKSGETQQLFLAPFGNSFLKKSITVQAESFPALNAQVKLDAPIPAKDPLIFKLDKTDQIFEYRLVGNDQSATCTKTDSQVACDLTPLQLAQSKQYELSLQRLFNEQPAEVAFTQKVTTIEAVQVTGTSIKNGEKLFGIPTEIVVNANKALVDFKAIRLEKIVDAGREQAPITPRVEGDKLIVALNEPLGRAAKFELIVSELTATDRSYLPSPHVLGFETSGGPKVLGISIGSSRVAPGAAFTLTFDTNLAANQALKDFIHIESGGNAVAATYVLRGRTVTVTPTPLARCAGFSVRVLDGLKNEAGIGGGAAWRFNSRTACGVSYSIGTSVQGRGIVAHKFGSGPSKIIFAGTLHGDEKSASSTLTSFVNYLEANAEKIPAHRTIIVIPIANPDGYAANTRTNANNVDLNRNFPANNWKQSVTMPNGQVNSNGGGSAPLSEPESRALANYVLSEGARLVMSYHSVAAIVAANESGDSLGIAKTYGNQVGFPAYGNEGGAVFHYDTTGAFEDWLRDKYGIPGILVELATKASNEFSRQQTAMWHLVNLP